MAGAFPANHANPERCPRKRGTRATGEATHRLPAAGAHVAGYRYVCFAGHLPCAGKCGESSCPQLCLCLEVRLFGQDKGLGGGLELGQDKG